MARKTFDVAEVKSWVNERLAQDHYSDMEKYAFANLLDHILTKTGNYHGFGYIDSYDAENHDFHADVRRRYY